jgi:hypothetical protein
VRRVSHAESGNHVLAVATASALGCGLWEACHDAFGDCVDEGHVRSRGAIAPFHDDCVHCSAVNCDTGSLPWALKLVSCSVHNSGIQPHSTFSALSPGTLAPHQPPPGALSTTTASPLAASVATPRSPLRSPLTCALSACRDGHPGRLEHEARRGKGEGRAARRRDRDPIAYPAARAREQTPEEPAAQCL